MNLSKERVKTMKFDYCKEKKALEILKKIKIDYILKNTICVLFLIEYIIFMYLFTGNLKARTKFSLIYILIYFIVLFIMKRNSKKKALEIVALNCPEITLNYNIYYYKIYAKYANSIFKTRASYQKGKMLALNNIATAYYQMNNNEEVNKIIEYIETLNYKSKDLNELKRTVLLNLKTHREYIKGNKKELSELNTEFKNVLKESKIKVFNLPEEFIDLKEKMLENNISEVNRLCDILDNSNDKNVRVMSSIYRVKMMDKNKIDGKEKYYKFITENGYEIKTLNDGYLQIDNTCIKTAKLKHHVVYNIFISIILFVLSLFTLGSIDELYERNNILWDSGEIIVLNKSVKLPCTIDEFEQVIGKKLEYDEVNNSYNIKLKDIIVDFKIKENVITGLIVKEIYDSGPYNKVVENKISGLLTEEIYNSTLYHNKKSDIVFPGNVSVYDSLSRVRQIYRTGPLNMFKREWHEEVENSKYISRGINLTGIKYTMFVDAQDDSVTEIGYFIK